MNAPTKPPAEGKLTEGETNVVALPASAGPHPAPRTDVDPAPARKRRGGRVALMLVVPLLLAAGGGYAWVTGGRYQETDNANLKQARVSIASEIPGRIVSMAVHDSAAVKAGDVLFTVEPEPYRIALAQADAALAAARINVEQLRAQHSQAVAQERSAAGEVEYLRAELERAVALADKGVGSKSTLDSARRDLAKAEEQHRASLESVAGALAALGGDASIPADRHPAVLSAMAQRDKAAYQLAQTTVRAPADGVVSQAASVKIGQYVGAGTALFALVETGDTWVEANFKETQLTHLAIGQKAEVTLDTYPDRPLEAVVESIGAGTGAEFSLLPAQNATGNWVKVTQRIPVRLRIEGDAAAALRTGMSATVAVDTGVSRGFAGLFGTAQAAE